MDLGKGLRGETEAPFFPLTVFWKTCPTEVTGVSMLPSGWAALSMGAIAGSSGHTIVFADC